MRLSACSIVKNEAKNIARSIESYKSVVDEIIIVDTGSTDNTVEICENLGARVLHFEWINDFAAAKNYALEHAKGDWIIFLDADEWFVPELNDDRVFKVLDRVEKMDNVGIIKTILCNVDENTGFISSRNTCARIFKNGPDVRYSGKIHEDVWKGDKPIKQVTLEELEIYHCGYSGEKVTQKSIRNLEILYEIYRKGKADTATYFYLCRENSIIGNYNEALKFYELFFRQKDCEQVILSANIFVSIYETGIIIKQNCRDKFTFKDILETINIAIEKYPEIPKHSYLKAIHYYNIDYDEALNYFADAVRLHEEYKGPYINSFAHSLPDAYYKVAQIYRARHMTDKAFDYYLLSLQEQKLQEGPFKELLQLIRDQSDEDIILFINSLYDIKNMGHVEFLAKQLMTSRLHSVFLYYALKYNQEFDGQDETTYIAMILANKEEIAVETAMAAYFNAGKEEDRYFAALAILCKKRTDLCDKYKASLNPAFSSILYKYLGGEKLANPSKEEISAFLQLYRYMFYIGLPDDIVALENFFVETPLDVTGSIMECYVSYKDNCLTIDKALSYLSTQKTDHFKTQMHKILGFSYCLIKDYTKSVEHFKTALESKHIDIDRNIIIYLKLTSGMENNDVIRHKALKLYERYSPIFEEYVITTDMVRTGKLEDKSGEGDLKKIREMTKDVLDKEIEIEMVKLPELVLKAFFSLVEKYLEKDMDVCAHNMIIHLLKNEYKKDILYYRLGEIYTRLNNPDMSLYCHNRVLEENATFAETLITDPTNSNRNYIYKPVVYNEQKQCPLCGTKASLHSVYNSIINPDFSPEYPAIKVWRYCTDCQHMFAAHVPEEVSFEMEEEKAQDAVKGLAFGISNYEESIHDIWSLAKGTKLLDIGSGNGQFSAAALEYGFEVSGIEPSKKLAELCSKALGMIILDCSFENFQTMEKYDVITMGSVLESITKPKVAVRRIYELLNTDGLFYIETPNFKSGYARVMKDKSWAIRSGKIANYYSKDSLYSLLRSCGFVVLSYRMSKRNNGYMEVIARKTIRGNER